MSERRSRASTSPAVTAWFDEQRARRRGPARRSTSSPAATRTSPSGSPTPPAAAACCAARRSARCWPPPTTWAASTGSSRPSAPPTCRSPRRSASAPTTPSTARRSTSWTSSTASSSATPPCAEALSLEARAPRRRLARRHARRDPRRRPRRRRPRRPRQQGGLHRPPAQALVRPVGAVEDARAAPRRRGARRACSPRIPEQGPAAIVHGDYRLDNCMVDDDGDVIAVLDWELCTLGDPLADVGLLMVYWTEPDDERAVLLDRAHHQPRASSRRSEVLDALRRGRPAGTCRRSTSTSPSATGSWPASSRASTPATSAAPWAATAAGFEGFAHQVERCAGQAAAAVERLGEPDRWPALRAASSSPTLDAPVLIMVLEGWIDAGLGADGAADAARRAARARTRRHLRRRRPARLPGPPPVMHLVDGVNTQLTWPAIELRAGHATTPATTSCCSSAPSPTTPGWRSPTQVVDLALDLGARMVVGFGAYPAPVPHTRPPLLAATASTPTLAAGPAPAHARGAGRRPGRDRAPGRRARAAGARALGPGAALRRRPCPTRPPALALLEAANRGRRPRPARSATSPTRAEANRARLDELVAGNPEHLAMLAPARGRRPTEHATDAARPPPRATSWPPSSSGSSASRATEPT